MATRVPDDENLAPEEGSSGDSDEQKQVFFHVAILIFLSWHFLFVSILKLSVIVRSWWSIAGDEVIYTYASVVLVCKSYCHALL